MGIAHSGHADEQERSVRRVEMQQLDVETVGLNPETAQLVGYDEEGEDSDCVHAGLDCETESVCSAGCQCGCASRLDDEIAEFSRKRFRGNIKEVIEKYILHDDIRYKHVIPVDEVPNFIRELYEAVGISE